MKRLVLILTVALVFAGATACSYFSMTEGECVETGKGATVLLNAVARTESPDQTLEALRATLSESEISSARCRGNGWAWHEEYAYPDGTVAVKVFYHHNNIPHLLTV